MDLDMFFGILIFEPKWWVCMGYSLCMMADFQNDLISPICRVFGAVFCTEQLLMIFRMDFDLFFWILIFDSKWRVCMGYSLCMMADFQNGLISPIFRIPCMIAISFAWSPIFKMVSFRQYFMFFGAVFLHTQL